MAVLTVNDLETARFGVVCARLEPEDALPDPRAIDRAAADQAVAMITARILADDLPRVRRLEAGGFRLMDTLVYYGRCLENLPRMQPLPPSVKIREADSADGQAIAELSRAAFAGFMGHYHADPRLDDPASTEAYADWAVRCLENPSNTTVLVATANEQISGYIACRRNTVQEVEVLLNAVCPARQRHGIYTALFHSALLAAQREAAARLIVSTQINNYAVQKVWSRLGLVHERSYYTLHKWMDEAG